MHTAPTRSTALLRRLGSASLCVSSCLLAAGRFATDQLIAEQSRQDS
jgi:hypothetical protein